MDKNKLKKFGKIFLALIVVGVIVTGAYNAGM